MFLNQARPANGLDDIKEVILEWVPFGRSTGLLDSSSTAAEVNPFALEAYTRRAQEIEHKRALFGSNLASRN